ncbi:MAG: uridine kinase [Anaerolineales bacterium]|nr:uridine kinase [Anaerolineales bacterium]
MPPTPLVIGLAGGSGSGKTTVANVILRRLGAEHLAYVPHDAYYRSFHELPDAQRQTINWDHPNSLETELMAAHIQALKRRQPIELPVYDFITYTRTSATLRVEPQPLILVEGILIFTDPALRALFDMKIFVDTDADLRFIRRLQRDIAERGRTAESVIHQYLATVRPMHLEFVEPSKRYADIIVPEGGRNEVALEMIVARLEALLARA